MEVESQMIIHLDTEVEWRGGQQQAIYLIEGLLKKQISTLLICRPDSKLFTYAIKNQIPVETLPLRSEYDIISALKLRKIIKKKHAKIVHCHNSHALGLAILTKFMINVKILASRRVDFPLKKNIFSRYKYNSRKLDRLICISDNIRNIVQEANIKQEKLITIRSAIDVGKAQTVGDKQNLLNDYPPEKFIIGTVAALTGHKDYPTFIEACRLVAKENQQVLFLALGDGKLKEELAALIEEKGLTNKFILLGHKTNVYDFLKRFDIFVLASKLEGLGTSVLDALSCGCSIVATKAGGIPEMIRSEYNGILVEKQAPQTLAQAIISLMNDSKKRNLLSRNAKESVRQFDISILIEQHLKLYKELMEK